MPVSNTEVLTNLIWRYAERFLAVLISFVVSLVLARLLSPEAYGTVAILNVLICILEIFCTRGYNQALVQKKIINEIDYNTIFWANLIIEVCLFLLIFFIAPLIAKYYGNKDLAWMLRALGIRLLITGFNSIQQAYVQRNMLFRKFFFSTLLGTLFSGGVGVLLAFNGFGAWALVMQSLINPFIDTIVLRFTIDWKPKFQFSFSSFKEMTPFGIRLVFMGLLDSIYGNIRSLIIGKKYSSSSLAYHDIGQSLPSLLINNTQTAASNVFFSALSRENSIFDLKEKMRIYIRMMFFLLCPIMIGMACISHELIIFLFTSKWENSSSFMVLYCFDFLLTILAMPINLSLMAVRKERIVLFTSIINRFSGIVVLLFVLNSGPFIIALGGLIIDYFVLFIMYIAVNKLLDYKFIEIIYDLWKTIICTLCMAIIIFSENLFMCKLGNTEILFIKIFTGVGLYILFSFCLKNEELVKILKILKRKLVNCIYVLSKNG